MNLQELKREAHEQLLGQLESFDEADEAVAWLNTLIDKVVDAVEESVVPKEVPKLVNIVGPIGERATEVGNARMSGFNSAVLVTREAFRNFRGV